MTLRTEQLIRSLVADLPTPSGSVAKALSSTLLLSLLVSLAAMLLWLGPRPGMEHALQLAPFWIKAGYTFLIGTAGLLALERLGRPGAEAKAAVWMVVVTVGVLVLGAALEFLMAPRSERSELFLGSSYTVCPWVIAVLSGPLLVGAFVALKKLAPTRFVSAGAAAGLMAGGYGACIYSLHCTEYGLPFLATWYTLGVLLVVAAGMLLSRLLQW